MEKNYKFVSLRHSLHGESDLYWNIIALDALTSVFVLLDDLHSNSANTLIHDYVAYRLLASKL